MRRTLLLLTALAGLITANCKANSFHAGDHVRIVPGAAIFLDRELQNGIDLTEAALRSGGGSAQALQFIEATVISDEVFLGGDTGVQKVQLQPFYSGRITTVSFYRVEIKDLVPGW
jgi:hypothetical protein